MWCSITCRKENKKDYILGYEERLIQVMIMSWLIGYEANCFSSSIMIFHVWWCISSQKNIYSIVKV